MQAVGRGPALAVLHGDSHRTETIRREATDDIVPGHESPTGTPCAAAYSAFTSASETVCPFRRKELNWLEKV